MKRLSVLLILLLSIVTTSVFPQRKSPPVGKDSADKVQSARLDQTVTGKVGGKTVKVTPIISQEPSLRNGQIVGVMETEARGSETNLPPGKYNLRMSKVGGQWHCYAEANGKVVAEGRQVSVEERRGSAKSEIFASQDDKSSSGKSEKAVRTGWRVVIVVACTPSTCIVVIVVW